MTIRICPRIMRLRVSGSRIERVEALYNRIRTEGREKILSERGRGLPARVMIA